MSWLEALLDLVFPPRPFCPLCGEVSAGAKICASCLKKIAQFRQVSRCFCCGRFGVGKAAMGWQETGERKFLCPECLDGEHCFTLARSAGPYEGNLKDAIHRFKFGKKRSLAKPLGRLLAEAVKEILFLINQGIIGGEQGITATGESSRTLAVAGLIPVPLARIRLQERGFNQSELFAQEIAALIGLPVLPILQKVRETPPQTGLSRLQRKINLSGAFTAYWAAKDPFPFPVGCPVILIDDVFTTGFTADECARVLLNAGVKEVYVATLATAI